ncbi:nuclear transport factor 2 family protein [Jatrophihabitans sp. DSM 45814]
MTELPDPIQRLLDAANAGDQRAFLTSFTADGVVDDWGREFHGPRAIEKWSDAEFIGSQVSLEVGKVEERGGEYVVTAEVGGNGFVGPSHFSFRVAGDAIARMTIRA